MYVDMHVRMYVGIYQTSIYVSILLYMQLSYIYFLINFFKNL